MLTNLFKGSKWILVFNYLNKKTTAIMLLISNRWCMALTVFNRRVSSTFMLDCLC